MLIYLHEQGTEEIAPIEVDPDATVGVLVTSDEVAIWIEDAETPVGIETTFVAAGLVDRGHVHRSRCRRVAVTVRFNGVSKEHDFAPGATVERVFRWATGDDGFDLPPGQRATHTLGVTGSDTEADRDAHVGSLATDCAVSFDLVPKSRYAG